MHDDWLLSPQACLGVRGSKDMVAGSNYLPVSGFTSGNESFKFWPTVLLGLQRRLV